MSERLQEVFNAEHRLPREALERLDARDLRELESSVLGEVNRPYRIRAMDALVAARGAGATEALAKVLVNEDEDPALRAAAASQLGRVGSSAEGPLVGALEADSPTIVVAAAGALGMVGSPAAIEPLQAVADRDDLVGQQARFAATLIAFRAGRAGFEPPRAADREVLAVPERGRMRLFSKPTGRDEAVAALADLSQDSFGMRLAPEAALRVDCARERLLIAIDPERRTVEGPTLAALVARRSYAQGTYSTNWVVLAWPGEGDAVEVGVYRPSGHQVLSGTARQDEASTSFELRSVQGRGNLPVEVRGTVEGGLLTAFEGETGDARPLQGEPQPE